MIKNLTPVNALATVVGNGAAGGKQGAPFVIACGTHGASPLPFTNKLVWDLEPRPERDKDPEAIHCLRTLW